MKGNEMILFSTPVTFAKAKQAFEDATLEGYIMDGYIFPSINLHKLSYSGFTNREEMEIWQFGIDLQERMTDNIEQNLETIRQAQDFLEELF